MLRLISHIARAAVKIIFNPAFTWEALTHLTFGSNAYVSVDRRLRAQVDGFLNADVSQGVFSKDRTCIKVGSHEATEARQCLFDKTE